MKKLLFLLVAFAAMLAACSKDDGLSGDEGTLVGAWKLSGGSATWVFLEDGTCYSESGGVGTWRYYVPSSTGGDYKGFLATEYTSSSGKGYTTNWWVISVSDDVWIGTDVTGSSEYTYKRIELDKEKYKKNENAPEPSKNDEGIKISLSFTKDKTSNTCTCTVQLTGDVESEDVSEIGIRFAPASSSEEPFLLFAYPSSGKLSYTTTRTLAISENVMGYAIVKGKTYKTDIKTISITTNNKKK